MNHSDGGMTRLRRLAWLCAVLVLAITSLSAFIRLSRAGLGCSPWPQCYTQSLGPGEEGLSPELARAVAGARIAHRILAVGALLLVIAMLMTTVTQGAMTHRREGRSVLALLGLALFLAVLGRWTAGARVPAVTLANLLAGFAMFAISWRLARTAGSAPSLTPAQRPLAGWARLGLALLVAQIVLGGLVSAGHAGLSCPQLSGCDTAGASWQALDPWREPVFDAGDLTRRSGALVHLLHRAGAVVVAAVLLPLGVAAWRSGLRAGPVLLLLVALQAALGVTLVLGNLPLAAALAHNVTAALLLALLLGLAAGGRTASRKAAQA